jgi:SAM-dependent methyltransferase
LVLCSLSLGYFQNIRRVFREFTRVSRPGGFIAVSDVHPEALASGWSRAFKVGEQRYEIENQQRTMQEIGSSAAVAGLRLKSCQSIHFGAPELALFQRAGKPGLFETVKRIPALFTCLWEKPC